MKSEKNKVYFVEDDKWDFVWGFHEAINVIKMKKPQYIHLTHMYNHINSHRIMGGELDIIKKFYPFQEFSYYSINIDEIIKKNIDDEIPENKVIFIEGCIEEGTYVEHILLSLPEQLIPIKTVNSSEKITKKYIDYKIIKTKKDGKLSATDDKITNIDLHKRISELERKNEELVKQNNYLDDSIIHLQKKIVKLEEMIESISTECNNIANSITDLCLNDIDYQQQKIWPDVKQSILLYSFDQHPVYKQTSNLSQSSVITKIINKELEILGSYSKDDIINFWESNDKNKPEI